MLNYRVIGAWLLMQLAVSSGFHLTARNVNEGTENRQLVLDGLNITSMDESSLSKFPNLRLLILEENPIAVLPKDVFKYNRELRILGIVNTSIAELHPDTFVSQIHVVRLYLIGNLLSSIDADLLKFNTNLTFLSLCNNRITFLNANTFKSLIYLKKINLADNHLTELPDGIFSNNKELLDISLENNRLKRIPAALVVNAVKLKRFYVDHNRLFTFDFNEFATNRKIADLSLHNNDLTNIEDYGATRDQLLPVLSNITITGNNFNCSYFTKMYDFFTTKDVTVVPRYSRRLQQDSLYNKNTCIDDDQYAAVSTDRASAADAPYPSKIREFVVKNITPVDGLQSFFISLTQIFALAAYEQIIAEQQGCEDGAADMQFRYEPDCTYWTPY